MGITQIDWSNAGFLRTYTMAFGASTVLTVILWLIAVVKRAVQGVHPVQAVGESIGFLFLSVVTSAFAPLAVAYVTDLFDGLADTMLAPAAGDMAKIGPMLTLALGAISAAGGPMLGIIIGLFLLTSVLGVWLELVVRNALIYVGLIFGPTVFSGLVERDLWSHTKRWVGVMAGIIGAKYVTFTALALATGVLASGSSEKASVAQAWGTLLTAVALFFLALYLPFQIAKFVPILGDQIQDVFSSRKQMEGNIKDAAGTAKSSFKDLQSRVGRSREAAGMTEPSGDDGADDAGAEDTQPELAAAKAGVEKTAGEAEQAAQRGVDGATASTGDGPASGPSDPGGPGGAGDVSSRGSAGALNPDGPGNAQAVSEGGGPGDAPSAPSTGAHTGD